MKKILIAETNAVTKAIFEIAFTDLQGFEGEVIFADTPDEAMNLIKIQSPDIFLISDGDEFEDIETLYNNARKTASNIPFVILYTLGKPIDFAKSDDPQVLNILLQKPFSVIKLLGIIKGLSEGIINENELIEEPFDKGAFIRDSIRCGTIEIPEILRDKEEYADLISSGNIIKNEEKTSEKPNLFLNFERNFTNKEEVKNEVEEVEVEEKPRENVFLNAMQSLDLDM